MKLCRYDQDQQTEIISNTAICAVQRLPETPSCDRLNYQMHFPNLKLGHGSTEADSVAERIEQLVMIFTNLFSHQRKYFKCKFL